MEIKFNRTGPERKALVKAISKITGIKEKYQFMPTCSFLIGNYTVTKEGNLQWDESIVPSEDSDKLLTQLAEMGCSSEKETKQESNHESFSISVPNEGFDEKVIDNLCKIILAKGPLIRKALQIERLDVIVSEETVKFPWFSGQPDVFVAHAALSLIEKLCDFAKNAKRVTAKELISSNEKYDFRVFLLRLGMAGDKYKADRKIMLKNLSGNAAFKSFERPLKAAQ